MLKAQVQAYTGMYGEILLCLRKSERRTSRFLIESFPNKQGISGGPEQNIRQPGTTVMKDKEMLGSIEP